jgi:ectoine hydroxylase-related dioxygenase (phytanoyl-CoA dioxygenase family)
MKHLSAIDRHALLESGFVIPGPVAGDVLNCLATAYDVAVASADPNDIGNGRTTTRVHDFVNRGAAFDDLYIHPPALVACELVIQQPFRLSTFGARTVRPFAHAQELHVDYAVDAEGWPMLGFILMVDDFRPDNGATRFVPGSHLATQTSGWSVSSNSVQDYVLACAPAGSMILYNGSVWYGRGANGSGQPRRSIQGAYIRRSSPPAVDFLARMHPDTLGRLSSVAKHVLAI